MEGLNAQSQSLVAVDAGSNYETVKSYVEGALTYQMNMYGSFYDPPWNTGFVPRAATVTITGVEQFDVIASELTNDADLIFLKGVGSYDGKGGDDTLYADLSTATTAVVFNASSDQTYNYLGSTFKDFERFLITTGSGDDVINTTAFNFDDWLSLGDGKNWAATGGGNDKVTSGGDDDTIDVAQGNDVVDSGAGNDIVKLIVDGNDIVRGGADTDRLTIDASRFVNSHVTGVYGRIWWEGLNAQGQSLVAVDAGSNYETVKSYVDGAFSYQMNMYGSFYDPPWNTGFVPRAATVTITGIEQFDVIASELTNDADLIFLKGVGSYDGKGGDDTLYADLSASSTAVVFNASSDQAYNYLGSTFKDFERFLITTGSGDDEIDTSAFNYSDWLSLAPARTRYAPGVATMRSPSRA